MSFIRMKENRTITEDEKLALLPKQRNEYVEPTDRGSLLQFNSTYTEYIDPAFIYRGSLGSLAGIFSMLFGLGMSGTFAYWITLNGMNWAVQFANVIGMSIGLIAFFLFFWLAVKNDFFTYIAYPVRFNRKNRKIYVFLPPR